MEKESKYKEVEQEITFERKNIKWYMRIYWAFKIIFGFKTKIKAKVRWLE